MHPPGDLDGVTGHCDRADCLSLIVEGLIDIANRHGGVELIVAVAARR